MTETKKYLAIKNWRKYQDIEDQKDGRVPWIKDFVDKDTDIDRSKMTMFTTGTLDRLYRLRARTAHILHNDTTWLIQAMHVLPKDAPHIPHAIRTLTERNFIIPTNDENFEAFSPEEEEEEQEEEKKKKKRKNNNNNLPPDGGSVVHQEKVKTEKPYCTVCGTAKPVPPNTVCSACMEEKGCDGQGVVFAEDAEGASA